MFFVGLLLLFLWVLELVVLLLREHGFDVVCSLNILAYFHIFIVIGFEGDKIGLFKPWNHHRKIKVAQWVQEQYLQLRIVLDVQIIELRVFEFLFLLLLIYMLFLQAVIVNFPGDVFEEQRNWSWYQVLENERRGNWKVSHRDELCLLGIEIDIAANAVCVCVQNHEDFVVVSLYVCIFFSAFWIQELLVFIRRFQLHLWAKIFLISGSIQTFYCLGLELLLMWASCRCAEVSTESIWSHKLEEELRWIAQASQASRIAWHDQEEHIRSWSFPAFLHLSYLKLKPDLISDWPGLTLLDWKESFQEEFEDCYKSALVT